MAPKKPKVWQSLPGDLKSLQKDKQRIRFNGFWLYEDERDRTIANWIEEQKEARRDVGNLIKELIYNEAKGERRTDSEIMSALDDLKAMIERGAFTQAGIVNPPKAEDVDDLMGKLRGMGT
jgi:hypothetical protein